MRGEGPIKRKNKGDADRDGGAHGRGRESAPVPGPIDDAMLRDYLVDALAPEESARVENLADLKAQSQTVSSGQASSKTRQRRFLQSSQHLLGEDKPS
jgi:hypothetical protein